MKSKQPVKPPIRSKITLSVVVVLAVVFGALFWLYGRDKPTAVTSYESCVADGNPVENSQPAKCSTPDGLEFVKKNNEKEPSMESELDTQYIGLSETQAQKLAQYQDRGFRVVKRDGEGLPMTMDFMKGRINADVEGGKVVKIQIEGEE